jgi:hypothetical protein
MPLNKKEQRALDGLERALADQDPSLARRLGGRYSEPIGHSVLSGVLILLVVGAGFTLVALGDDVHLVWVSAVGAVLAATSPFLAATRMRGR